MKEILEHWKEGLGILAYFGFLAFFTPRAEALGWGYKGILLCVLAGALLVTLIYSIVRCIAEYIADHREEVNSFREYMGIGANPEQASLASIGTVDDHTADELDAMLAANPYATPDLFDDDRYTRLLPSGSAGGDTRFVDEAELDRGIGEEVESAGGRVAAILGENPRRRLHLADNFKPDANDPLATGVFVVGIPGSGKTVTLALFLEQYITLFHLAMVIFDIAGDLKSIVEDGLCPRGLIGTPDSMPSMAHVVKHRMQVVIDLQQCRRPGEAFINYELAGQLIAKTIKDLMNAQSAIDPYKRLPCLIGLDETHIWAPQNPPSYLSPATAKDLLDTLSVVATTGRKYGVVPFFAAQRIPKVHKDIIAGCETRIFGKADLDNDIKRYREYVSPDIISDQGIRQLPKGRMVVCINGKRLIVQFYQRASRHVSHTPGVTQALNNLVGRIPPELLESITHPAEVVHPASIPASVPPAYTSQKLPEQIAYIPHQRSPEQEQWTAAPYSNLREIRREGAAAHLPSLEQDIVSAPPQQRSLRHYQEKYAEAIAAWHELEEKQSPTMRDFAVAMNLNEAKAYKLLCEMERLGLIHWERRKKKVM